MQGQYTRLKTVYEDGEFIDTVNEYPQLQPSAAPLPNVQPSAPILSVQPQPSAPLLSIDESQQVSARTITQKDENENDSGKKDRFFRGMKITFGLIIYLIHLYLYLYVLGSEKWYPYVCMTITIVANQGLVGLVMWNMKYDSIKDAEVVYGALFSVINVVNVAQLVDVSSSYPVSDTGLNAYLWLECLLIICIASMSSFFLCLITILTLLLLCCGVIGDTHSRNSIYECWVGQTSTTCSVKLEQQDV